MELVRHSDESQRAFVERMLMEHGEVRVYDLVYNARFDDGTKCSLTRTATHVWSLRHEDGLDIETTGASATSTSTRSSRRSSTRRSRGSP